MTNRRAFLRNTPAGILGFQQLSETLFGQEGGSSAEFDTDIASFWANHMDVPPDILAADVVVARGGPSVPPASFEREPFLLYYDESKHELVPAMDVKPTVKSGDVMLNLEVSRYRLNGDDQNTFAKYQSGGMYLDVQQKQSTAQNAMDMAFSVFSAIFPQGMPKGGSSSGSGGKSGAKAKDSKSGGSSTSAADSSAKPAPSASAAASTPSLQHSTQTQSIGLPNCSGKTSLVVFAKDKRKTAFGFFVSALTMVSNVAQPSYLSLLSLPSIATPALAAVRALVANLQSHGGNHQWLLQGPPMEIAATEEAAGSSRKSAKFNSGYVVAVPKIQVGKMKTSNVQIFDGFVIPADKKPTEAYDWIAANPPDASYLTLSTSVQKTKLNNCSVSSLLKG